MINIAIVGAAGRMGKILIEACAESKHAQLSVATEHSGSSLLGADAGEVAGIGKNGVTIVSSLDDAANDFDVLIDFTRPEPTLKHLAWCVTNNKSMIIGTTGFSDAEKADIDAAGPAGANQLRTLEENCKEFGIKLFGMGHKNQGIVHVMGPELGITQPGQIIVCGDSHTATHGRLAH